MTRKNAVAAAVVFLLGLTFGASTLYAQQSRATFKVAQTHHVEAIKAAMAKSITVGHITAAKVSAEMLFASYDSSELAAADKLRAEHVERLGTNPPAPEAEFLAMHAKLMAAGVPASITAEKFTENARRLWYKATPLDRQKPIAVMQKEALDAMDQLSTRIAVAGGMRSSARTPDCGNRLRNVMAYDCGAFADTVMEEGVFLSAIPDCPICTTIGNILILESFMFHFACDSNYIYDLNGGGIPVAKFIVPRRWKLS